MIVSNALVKVGHCQVNYNHPPRTKKLAGGFAFAQSRVNWLYRSGLRLCGYGFSMNVLSTSFV
jgi:hypothetical protein